MPLFDWNKHYLSLCLVSTQQFLKQFQTSGLKFICIWQKEKKKNSWKKYIPEWLVKIDHTLNSVQFGNHICGHCFSLPLLNSSESEMVI